MSFQPLIFERDDRVYLVSPVAPFEPAESDIEEYAFSQALRQGAPNANILWMRGQYVEADAANENGALWTADELAISSLTPNFMPVTVMHDPRTAVGVIADTRLLTRERDSVPRSRLDNTLALWRHRFPDVAEEALANYSQGSLMQSMECLPTHYDCGTCGTRFPKLPGNAERANWCRCLRGEEAAKAVRILGNVCFTGTGLIFGTRGARGAYSDAHLDVLQEEVAEHHERVHRGSHKPSTRTRSRKMDIDDSRYQELLASETKATDLQKRVDAAEETAAKVPGLETKIEETETAKVAAEKERDELKVKVDKSEEDERASTLAKDRLGKLGSEFLGRLGDFTRGRLEEQAKTATDEEWDSTLKEKEELAGVKRDAKKDGEPETPPEGGGSDFSREETARTQAGSGAGNGNSGTAPSPEKRRSVVAGLVPGREKAKDPAGS